MQGQLDRARAEFERSLQIDPAFLQAREDLALVLRATRR
jgi:Tfp pilus assembly protein PilF